MDIPIPLDQSERKIKNSYDWNKECEKYDPIGSAIMYLHTASSYHIYDAVSEIITNKTEKLISVDINESKDKLKSKEIHERVFPNTVPDELYEKIKLPTNDNKVLTVPKKLFSINGEKTDTIKEYADVINDDMSHINELLQGAKEEIFEYHEVDLAKYNEENDKLDEEIGLEIKKQEQLLERLKKERLNIMNL